MRFYRSCRTKIKSHRMKRKITIIAFAFLPIMLFGQNPFNQKDAEKMEYYTKMLNALSKEELIKAAAKAMFQTDQILDVSISQDNTLVYQSKRLELQEKEIESLKKTIKSLDIVVQKQVEEIEKLKNK